MAIWSRLFVCCILYLPNTRISNSSIYTRHTNTNTQTVKHTHKYTHTDSQTHPQIHTHTHIHRYRETHIHPQTAVHSPTQKPTNTPTHTHTAVHKPLKTSLISFVLLLAKQFQKCPELNYSQVLPRSHHFSWLNKPTNLVWVYKM